MKTTLTVILIVATVTCGMLGLQSLVDTVRYLQDRDRPCEYFVKEQYTTKNVPYRCVYYLGSVNE